MKTTLIIAGVSAVVAFAASSASAGPQHHVVPGDFANAPGDSAFLGPMAAQTRINQMILHESLLTDLIGRQLTGISFRLPAPALNPWPPTDANFDFYEVYLSQSVAPSEMSQTFAANVVGERTQVRSGGLTMFQNDFSNGESPNQFGTEIGFDQGWTYTGGHLAVEIRHSGHDSWTIASDAIDAWSEGYGEKFRTMWTWDLDGTFGSEGNFAIMQFTSVPGPGALALLGLAGFCAVSRRRV